MLESSLRMQFSKAPYKDTARLCLFECLSIVLCRTKILPVSPSQAKLMCYIHNWKESASEHRMHGEVICFFSFRDIDYERKGRAIKDRKLF